MTIILFIVDNSISMNQKTYSGCSFLDIAKKAVETFLKIRSRDPGHRLDRIMLMTFDEPFHLKVGWRESLMVFQNELKNMQATAMSSGSQILSSAFEILNVNRLQSGIDTYGQGRNPFYVESAVIVLLTDGHNFTDSQSELVVTMSNRIPGLELTKEPYRWDQRLFSVVLRMPGIRAEEKTTTDDLPRDTSVLEGFSYITGGRSFAVESVRTIDSVMVKIADNMQNGVMVRLEPFDEVPPNGPSISVNRMVYLPRNPQKTHVNGHWPLPEPFWLDGKTQNVLPPRSSHPVLKYRASMEDIPQTPNIRDVVFPVDKYEVEHSALTEEVLEKCERFKHWPVYIDAEIPGKQTVHQLCGYLAIQSKSEFIPGAGNPDKVLTLNVLPIDYPRLFHLLERFSRDQNGRSKEWKAEFDTYIQDLPAYMTSALRRFLLKVNLHALIPESFDQYLSYDLQNYLRKVKTQAKTVFDNTVAYPNQPFPVSDAIPVIQRSSKTVDQRTSSAVEPVDGVTKEGFDALLAKSVADRIDADAAVFLIHLRAPSIMQQRAHIPIHRNPFDVDRGDLVSQLSNLKFSLLHPDRWKGTEEPDKHIPIAQMGNYQEYLKTAPKALRDLDDGQKVDRPMFGNPFQDPRKQKQRMAASGMDGMVDEADVDFGSTNNTGYRKRSMSDSRDPSGPSTGKLRSRSMSPGLRSPIKRRPEPETGGTENGLSAGESADIASSKRRLIMGSQPEISGLEPVGTFADLIMDDHETATNGSEVRINGLVRSVLEDEDFSDVEYAEPDSDVVRDFRIRALKAIKTPGRNFKPILDMINGINGNVSLKRTVIHHVIQEAGRFRRDSLIDLLKETYAL